VLGLPQIGAQIESRSPAPEIGRAFNLGTRRCPPVAGCGGKDLVRLIRLRWHPRRNPVHLPPHPLPVGSASFSGALARLHEGQDEDDDRADYTHDRLLLGAVESHRAEHGSSTKDGTGEIGGGLPIQVELEHVRPP